MKKLALFEGSWQKVLIKAIMLLLVLYAMYRIIKMLTKKTPKSEQQIIEYIENELPSTTPPDNSNNADPETLSDSEADLIANNLQIYMDGWGTNESSMFSALECLNGASLNKVYASFGAREYDGTMMDLYAWFSEELSNMLFSSGVFFSECVPECNGYWDSCYALTYMRRIWSKSSIPVSF
jgi:hypothetical protein